MNQQQVEVATSHDNFGMVPHTAVAKIWHLIQPLLLKHGGRFLEIYSLEEVFRELTAGTADLWLAGKDECIEGLVICAWERHDKAAFYHILFCCGSNMDYYFDFGLKALERFACLGGAREVVLDGRPGWKRLLEKRGYKNTSVRLKKATRVLWSN